MNLAMKDQPRWKELCELASVEQDSQKLMELITEINHLLEEKQSRLKHERFNPTRIEE
jgi:hypothetical protein